MITVHHLENSRSQRVLWLLEELVVPYEVKRYARDPKTMLAPQELRAIHPLGKSPIITDGEITVAETGAIFEYLMASYGAGRLVPAPGTPEHRAYTYWLHYAEGSAMTPILMGFVFQFLPKGAPALMRPFLKSVGDGALKRFVNPQIAEHLRFCEDALSKSEWFAGSEFSAADIIMSFPIEIAAAGSKLADLPRLRTFHDRIQARPAYKRALERGGPYGVGVAT